MDRRTRNAELVGLAGLGVNEQLVESVAANTLAIAFPPFAPVVPFVDALLHPQRLFRQLTHPSEWLGAIEGFFGFGGGPSDHQVAINRIVKNIKMRAVYAHRVVAFSPRVKALNNPAVIAKYNELVGLVSAYPVIRDNASAARYKDPSMRIPPYPAPCAKKESGWCDPERARIVKQIDYQLRVLKAMMGILESPEYRLRVQSKQLVSQTEQARSTEQEQRKERLRRARAADIARAKTEETSTAAARSAVKEKNAAALVAAQKEAKSTIAQAQALGRKIAVAGGQAKVSSEVLARYRQAEKKSKGVRSVTGPAPGMIRSGLLKPTASVVSPVGWAALAGGVLALVVGAL